MTRNGRLQHRPLARSTVVAITAMVVSVGLVAMPGRAMAGRATAGRATAGRATAGAAATTPGAGSYVPVPQSRVLDTRAGAAVPGGGARTVAITGHNGIPASGVGTVALTVVALDHTNAGYLTVYSDGTTRPAVPSVTFSAGYTRDNHVLSRPGADGSVVIFNGSSATTDVIVDVSGYFTSGTETAAGGYQPVAPTRLVDTSGGTIAQAGEARAFAVTGHHSVPSRISAVVLDVGVIAPTGSGHVAINGLTADDTSALTYFRPEQSVSNLIVTPVDPNGEVTLTNVSDGTLRLTLDVVGYFVTGAPSTSGRFGPMVTPALAIDTRRSGPTRAHVPLPSGRTIDVTVAGTPGVPLNATAVVLNVAATNSIGSGYLTAYPSGSTRPGAVTLNFTSGRNMSDLAFTQIGVGGRITFYNGSSKPVDIVATVLGSVGAVPGPLHWTSPQQPQPVGRYSYPLLSCATPSFCLDVARAGRYTTYNGTRWTAPADIGTAAPAAVSCPSVGFCLAVNYIVNDVESYTVGAATYRNGRWTSTPPVPTDPADLPASVSCVSATFCVAVGWASVAGGGRVWIFDGSTWSHNIDTSSISNYGVSCVSPTLCLVLGNTFSGGIVRRYNGTTLVPTSADITDPTLVSCARGPFCLIASAVQTQAGDGTTWQPAVSSGSSNSYNGMHALSCAGASFCAGVFYNLDETSSVGFYDGTGWVPLADRALSGRLHAISCPTARFCAAISDDGFVSLGTRA